MCPLRAAQGSSAACRKPLPGTDLHRVMNEKLKRIYESKSLSMFLGVSKDSKICLTPDCGYVFCIDKGLNIVTCPKCRVKFCLDCAVRFNQGH